MKFSIVIPLYNKQNSIRRALYSALDQIGDEVQHYEIIVVNDGSTDNSLAIVDEVKRQHANRAITVYSQVNAGVSAARNKGIELARADHIAFLDADDTYEPYFLNEIHSLMKQFPTAVMFATAYRFVNTYTGNKRDARLLGLDPTVARQPLDDYFSVAAQGDLPVTSSSVCINKRVLESIGGFPCAEEMGEDQSVWSRIALAHPIAISQRVCANYFEAQQNSLMNTVAPSGEMPFSRRLQQRLDQHQVPEHHVQSVEKYIAGHLLDLVRRNLAVGNVETANALLTDQRARKQLKRYCYWRLRASLLALRLAVA